MAWPTSFSHTGIAGRQSAASDSPLISAAKDNGIMQLLHLFTSWPWPGISAASSWRSFFLDMILAHRYGRFSEAYKSDSGATITVVPESQYAHSPQQYAAPCQTSTISYPTRSCNLALGSTGSCSKPMIKLFRLFETRSKCVLFLHFALAPVHFLRLPPPSPLHSTPLLSSPLPLLFLSLSQYLITSATPSRPTLYASTIPSWDKAFFGSSGAVWYSSH